MTSRRQTKPAAQSARADHPVAVVLVGGPLDGYWWDVEGWHDGRAAAERMGYGPDRPAGVALGYVDTGEVVANPDPERNRCSAGVAWQWQVPA